MAGSDFMDDDMLFLESGAVPDPMGMALSGGAAAAQPQLALHGPGPVSAEHQKLVPQFVTKLYEIVNDPRYNDVICWTAEGTSFVVLNPDQFQTELLPKYFKHNNFSSFVRQLNLYNFKKLGKPNYWEFKHESFIRGHPHLLPSVRRKNPTQTDKTLREDVSALAREHEEMKLTLQQMQREMKGMEQRNMSYFQTLVLNLATMLNGATGAGGNISLPALGLAGGSMKRARIEQIETDPPTAAAAAAAPLPLNTPTDILPPPPLSSTSARSAASGVAGAAAAAGAAAGAGAGSGAGGSGAAPATGLPDDAISVPALPPAPPPLVPLETDGEGLLGGADLERWMVDYLGMENERLSRANTPAAASPAMQPAAARAPSPMLSLTTALAAVPPPPPPPPPPTGSAPAAVVPSLDHSSASTASVGGAAGAALVPVTPTTPLLAPAAGPGAAPAASSALLQLQSPPPLFRATLSEGGSAAFPLLAAGSAPVPAAGGPGATAASAPVPSAPGQPSLPAGVTALGVRKMSSDPDMARVQASIQQLMDAVVRVCIKCGYSHLLSATGFGAWFNVPAATQPDSKEPLAILVFPDKSSPPLPPVVPAVAPPPSGAATAAPSAPPPPLAREQSPEKE